MWRAGTLQPDAGSATFQLVELRQLPSTVSLRLNFLIFKMMRSLKLSGDNGIYRIGVVVTMTFIYLHQNPSDKA